MPNNAIAGDGVANPRATVDALMALLRNQFPALAPGAAITRQMVDRIVEIVKRNIVALLGASLTAVSLAVLLPSLFIALINAIGFTAGGVAAGSLAAAIQSAVFGASTTGWFSALQAFGATAVVASPAALILGGLSLAAGAGLLGYWLYRRRRVTGGGNPPIEDNGDEDPPPAHPSKTNAVAIRTPKLNFFGSFFSRATKLKSD